jgi:hypothetical protein
MADYNKDVEGGTTFNEGQTIKCDNATLGAHTGSTLTEADLECSRDASITCNGTWFMNGSTIVIDNLSCNNASINVDISSTVVIKALSCVGTCSISVDRSSTLNIESGSVNVIKGTVDHASTGICKATLKSDEVSAYNASKWIT